MSKPDPPPDDQPVYVPIADEARRFSISPEALRRAAVAKGVKIVRIGKRILMERGAADTLLETVPGPYTEM